MHNQVAIIPGGAKGIGRAIAYDLASRGWTIALCYRTSQVDAEQTLAEILRRGGQGFATACDVSQPEATARFVQETTARYGHIDALIHCAGPYHRVALFEETAAGWEAMFSGNLHSLFYVAQAVAPGMIARKRGHIITFGMANADRMVAQPNVTAHYIAKAGVLMLTRTLAKLLAPHQIRVNAISPGFIDSGSAPPEELTTALKTIPAGSLGSVHDMVGAVRFLLSDEARYVNGANIQISGAWGI